MNMHIAEHYLLKQPCPYFQDGRPACSEHVRLSDPADPILSAWFIQQGWRRYGTDLYRMRCEGCRLCIPIRINASKIVLSKSMSKILRRNRDLFIIPHKSHFSKAHLELWREYSKWKHQASQEDLDEASYGNLISPWGIIFEYRKERSNGELCAISHIDPLPDGFSSVYFSFLPCEASRSLGYFSVLAEARIALTYAMAHGMPFAPTTGKAIEEFYVQPRSDQDASSAYYYLGFWVPGADKMKYKARFRPFSLLLTDERNEHMQQWYTFDSGMAAEHLLRKIHWPGF